MYTTIYLLIYLLVKATIQTTHQTANEAVTELQKHSVCAVSDTKKVKVKELKFIDYKLKM